MKKLFAVLLAAAMCFALFACGSDPTPSDVVKSYLDAVKAQDQEAIAKVYAGEAKDALFDAGDLGEEDEMSEAFDKSMGDKFAAFEYTVKDEKVDGDKATVNVTLKTYNFGEVFSAAIEEYMSQAIALLFSDASEEEMDALMEKIFTEKLEAASLDYESDAAIDLTKTDEGWKIDKFGDDSDFLNAVSGGLADYLQGLGGSLSD
ncbi:DUF4878 domain-containing protein [Bacilliculturomica massiliensis]|uniref:DUF4878 domain-containing protein n=1 Tax=Bacilliculturomica massiliensis TaxID=1917867 RepID=UPI0010307451|nr:DUF4878 domain-containing protein [Bacilliculturomica massiliensis]